MMDMIDFCRLITLVLVFLVLCIVLFFTIASFF